MAGYGVMAAEIRAQGEDRPRPTHLFVQAGVGGLAAAMAAGLADWLARPGLVVAVEPERAACLAPALAAGRPVRVPGDLHTAAEMLSCGEASAPALAVLQRHGARVATVTEADLARAPRVLAEAGGPATTPSGAAGLAGLLAVLADPARAAELRLGREARVLVLVTEATLEAS